MSLWAIGVDPLVHGTICILMNYLVMRLFKGTLVSTVFLFIFQLGYLVIGYVILSVDTYDISWTMPHCVITLRLIGLAMDVFDGRKKPVGLKLLICIRKLSYRSPTLQSTHFCLISCPM